MMFRELYTKLTTMYLERYIVNPKETVETMCRVDVPVQILNHVYRSMVNDLTFKEIELLPKDEKQKLFDMYKSANVEVEKERIPKVCAAIYTLEFLSKNV